MLRVFSKHNGQVERKLFPHLHHTQKMRKWGFFSFLSQQQLKRVFSFLLNEMELVSVHKSSPFKSWPRRASRQHPQENGWDSDLLCRLDVSKISSCHWIFNMKSDSDGDIHLAHIEKKNQISRASSLWADRRFVLVWAGLARAVGWKTMAIRS